MITKKQKQDLEKYSPYSSFAIWTNWDDVGNVKMFENDDFLNDTNSDYILVALNPAEHPKQKETVLFGNFHSSYSYQKDFKLCYALQKTKLWGSYITDIWKSFPETDSSRLAKMLSVYPEQVKNDIESFKGEISIINKDAILIAIGRKAEEYLKQYFYDYKIVYIPHYSNWGSKESYRDAVICCLKSL